MQTRHFLFLQGLPGPAFRRIARRLETQGHRTSRINFTGGDLADWHFRGTAYRGGTSDFGTWLRHRIGQEQVTDLVLLGDRRPLHRQAIDAAQQSGIDVHVFEEGYLRPNSVTIERWRGGQPWEPPTSLAACQVLAANTVFVEAGIENRFIRRWREAVMYWIWTVLLMPAFPRYRSHRQLSAVNEMLAWLRRYLRRSREYDASGQALADLGNRPFFLFPLQLDGDAQLVYRSPFAAIEQAVSAVFASFASHAPDDLHLLVKRHPFDPDPRRWRRRIGVLAAEAGLSCRVHFVEFADLDALLAQCRGVVTVNSTVGGLALRQGRAVHVLGQALYAMPGLATAGPLAPFWTAPQPVAPDDFAIFAGALWQECLVNAGFHGKDALARLAAEAAQRLGRE